jgi:L-lysine 2,3-aminomutase
MIPTPARPLTPRVDDTARSADASDAPGVGMPAAGLRVVAGDWRRQWREAVRDPRELLALLDLAPPGSPWSDAAAAQFPLRVPRAFVARMRRGDPADPLLRQVLPLDEEMRPAVGYGLDAVGDAASRQGPGIIHKYAGRALLIATGSCAVHCRYCFRRHFPYAEETAAAGGWQAAVSAIAADRSISEVILSGGDPLSLSTAKLQELTTLLAAIPHVRRLRIHTRLPIVLPDRVDGGLCAWLQALPWPVVVVVHANHGNEFDGGVDAAMARMRASGATLLNQAVLLRGVNDSLHAQVALAERCFDSGVLPYYLHQLDRVTGAAHFEVDDDQARALHARLRDALPGYLVPRLVREVAGEGAKRPL